MDQQRTSQWTLPVLAAALLVLLFLAGCTKGPAREQSSSSQGGYTGGRACKECHEEVYNGWKATFHAYKFQLATPDFVIGDFVRDNSVISGKTTYRMLRDGQQFTMVTSNGGAEKERHVIRYAVGSIWKQRYITQFPDGGLHVLPLQWLVKPKRWEMVAGEDDQHWKRREAAFQFECLGCHTTRPIVNLDEGKGAFDTRWVDAGVSCEACHGPGQAHLEAPPGEKAETILNPAKLADPERAAMICGACHTRGMSTDQRHAWPVGYRPGGQLNFLFDTRPGVYPDGSPKEHHQQYDDWKNSGHAKAGVMCWDCHAPHHTGKSNRFQLKLPGSILCATCHQVNSSGVHSLHSVNNCMGCHMPRTVISATPGDLRSHRFVVVRPARTVEADGSGKQPNSCNLCHYHRDTDPERLMHFIQAVKKPPRCKQCHYHTEQSPEDEAEEEKSE